ncbi:MAG: MotA/TolQ/ExbB proton channel family protein [Candidatus Omnitrophica bacterium]|nr:MotA/TolQ/ExbB proton channel family protein [Candidatus Omnitrophota bacterium]
MAGLLVRCTEYWSRGGLLLAVLAAVCFAMWVVLLNLYSRLREEKACEPIPQLRKDLTVLKALVSAAPLLGLLGTVMGLVQTFGTLSAGGGPTNQALAQGVGRALVTTQYGLVIALPGLIGIGVIQRQIRKVELVHAVRKIEIGRAQ